jgi:hypothetical protein
MWGNKQIGYYGDVSILYLGELEICKMNHGVTTLLPKLENAERIQQYRLICLLNCICKWFTKVLTMRLEPIFQKNIHKSQTTFIKKEILWTNAHWAYHVFLKYGIYTSLFRLKTGSCTHIFRRVVMGPGGDGVECCRHCWSSHQLTMGVAGGYGRAKLRRPRRP